MLTEKFLFSFFLAKKIEKDYDNFFLIALGIFSCVSNWCKVRNLLLNNVGGIILCTRLWEQHNYLA